MSNEINISNRVHRILNVEFDSFKKADEFIDNNKDRLESALSLKKDEITIFSWTVLTVLNGKKIYGIKYDPIHKIFS